MPAFERYRLPDGRIVAVDASASHGALTITYTLRGGRIVTAVRVDEGITWQND